MTNKELKALKREKEINTVGNYQDWDHYISAMSQAKGSPAVLSTLTPFGWVSTVGEVQQEEQEKARKMNGLSQEKLHLQHRLYDVAYTKKNDLKKTFGLVDDKAPKSLKDLRARLDKGLYTFRDIVNEDSCGYHWTDLIRWRDPSVEEDQEGYDAALELVKKAELRTNDDIVVKTHEEGLAAFREFESTDFTKKSKK